jgi:predicted RNA-binding protein with TRAM domain
MEIPEQLRCLFSTKVEQQDETYVVEIPKQEIQVGDLQQGETYRVALLSSPIQGTKTKATGAQEHEQPGPPVEEGETREVEIEDIGEQGDGITRVDRGFVVIVPDTEQGERVSIEITDVGENVAFAEVTERLSYYD